MTLTEADGRRPCTMYNVHILSEMVADDLALEMFIQLL